MQKCFKHLKQITKTSCKIKILGAKIKRKNKRALVDTKLNLDLVRLVLRIKKCLLLCVCGEPLDDKDVDYFLR